MARSKALQAKEWWDDFDSLTQARPLNVRELPDRVRNPASVSRQPIGQPSAGLPSSSLGGTLNITMRFTAHAEARQAQRHLSNQDIGYVLLHGQTFHKAGAILVHLRRKDLGLADRADQRCQELVGTTVVLAAEGKRPVLTAYRNRRHGLRHIKRKPDYGY